MGKPLPKNNKRKMYFFFSQCFLRVQFFFKLLPQISPSQRDLYDHSCGKDIETGEMCGNFLRKNGKTQTTLKNMHIFSKFQGKNMKITDIF